MTVHDVEAFHLLFLRALETKLDRAGYVVKGGINLRFWFASPRLSEDMDLDALAIPSHVLRERVDLVLESAAFETLLRSQALGIVRVSAPKQTETTQRWKLEIVGSSRIPLHTKIEFSRRGPPDEHVLEPVRPEIVRPYGVPAPTANHYTAGSAARQKIGALAHRKEPQARDVWDLDHLLRSARADPTPLPAELQEALPVAIDRALQMPYEAFKSQVVPFLGADDQEVFGSTESWTRMQELVAGRLLELSERR